MAEAPFVGQGWLNMSTGPVETSAAVRRALGEAFASPHHAAFWPWADALAHRVGRILGFDGQALMLHGSIRTGIYLALANLVTPRMKVLALDNGWWGRLLGEIAAEGGAEVHFLTHPPERAFDGGAVRAALRAHPGTALVTAVHVETNTGIANRIAEIGPVVREAGALFLVDSACSAGAVPFATDAWAVDIGTTGSHKGFGAAPGMAILTLNERAWSQVARSPFSAQRTYASLAFLRQQILVRAGSPYYTQPAPLLRALEAALDEADTAGRDAWFRRHEAAADRFIAGIEQCGARLAYAPANGGAAPGQSATVMVVRYPPGVSDAPFRQRLIEHHGVFVIGNIGAMAGTSFRVGLMSAPQIAAENIERTLEAIADGFAAARTN